MTPKKPAKKSRSSPPHEPRANAPDPMPPPPTPPADTTAKRVLSLPFLGPCEAGSDARLTTVSFGARSVRARWVVIAAILVAWGAGFAARAWWLADKGTTPTSMFQDHRLLTTADAYFYATGVKHAVAGGEEQNPRMPTIENSIVVLIGAGAVQAFGVPVEDFCTWAPAIFAPLVAVPLVLLGLLYGQLLWGFLASLVAVLGFSYWNRTVPGYFDTDMVSIPYVIGVIVLLMAAFWRRRTLLGTLAAALAIAAPWVHPGSERVLAALVLGTFGYALVFHRKETWAWRVALAMVVAFLPGPFWIRLLVLAALELALARVRVPVWLLVTVTALTLALVCWSNQAMDLVLGVVGIRIPRGDIGAATVHRFRAIDGVSFPGIGDTVSELVDPSLDKLGERVAGHPALVVLGVVGWLAASWRFRPVLFFAPLIALGTVLAATGQRFTIFAVPPIALGNVWLMLLVARAVTRWVKDARRRLVEGALAVGLSAFAIGPAVAHALDYPARTALMTQDAELLSLIEGRAQPNDFIISWWDYSYSMWFFTGAQTIVDGSKQNQDLWIAAEVFFTPSQREAASLMRWAAEFQATHSSGMDAVIDDMVADFQQRTGRPSGDFVPALRKGEVELPKKTREVYFYVPWRFLQIAPNVAKIRPAKGLVPEDELGNATFLVMLPLKPDGTTGERPTWAWDQEHNTIRSARGERVPVLESIDVGTDKNGRVVSRATPGDPNGKVVVLNLHHAGLRIFIERRLLDSVMAQVLFLGRADPQFFEPIAYKRGGAILKLRI